MPIHSDNTSRWTVLCSIGGFPVRLNSMWHPSPIHASLLPILHSDGVAQNIHKISIYYTASIFVRLEGLVIQGGLTHAVLPNVKSRWRIFTPDLCDASSFADTLTLSTTLNVSFRSLEILSEHPGITGRTIRRSGSVHR